MSSSDGHCVVVDLIHGEAYCLPAKDWMIIRAQLEAAIETGKPRLCEYDNVAGVPICFPTTSIVSLTYSTPENRAANREYNKQSEEEGKDWNE